MTYQCRRYSSSGPNGMSTSGDQSIVLTHDGFSGHVRVLTGNASAKNYYYYDAQTGTTGTIAKTDSTIRGTFGYQQKIICQGKLKKSFPY